MKLAILLIILTKAENQIHINIIFKVIYRRLELVEILSSGKKQSTFFKLLHSGANKFTTLPSIAAYLETVKLSLSLPQAEETMTRSLQTY